MIRHAGPNPIPRVEMAKRRDPLEPVVVGGVVATIALATAFYGGVEAWFQPLLVVVGVAATVVAALRWRSDTSNLPLVALLLLAGIAAAQLAPLPLATLDTISPARAEAVREYAGDDVAAATPSYYAPETRRAVVHVLAAAAILAAVASTVRSTRGVKRLLAGLAAVGLAEAMLALAQVVTEAPGVYWNGEVSGGAWVGSFLNHSNFAQAINTAIGAGVGLLLVRLAEDRRRKSRPGRPDQVDAAQRHGGLLIGIGLGVVALAAALSRGGLIAAAAAACVVSVAMNRRGGLGWRGWAFAGAAGVALVGVLLLDFDSFYERLGTLRDGTTFADRIELSLATLRVGWRHALTGVGLAAHRYAFPAYDTTGSVALAEQADNDYAQVLEETGLPGAIAVGLFVAGVGLAIHRALRGSRDARRYAAYGVLYALVAAVVHSLSDFGQRLPAVFVGSATLAGVACSLATPRRAELARPKRSPARWAVLAAAAPVWGWLLWESVQDYRAERWWARAYAAEDRLRTSDWEGPAQDYVDLITAAERAHALRPRDVDYAFWLNAYRWHGFNLAAATAEVDAAERRTVTERIADELTATRRGCPTYGPVHTLEGQVRLALGEREAAAELLENGVRLSPNDPQACLAAATAATLVDPPDVARGLELLDRVVALDGSSYGVAAEAAIDLFGRVDEARRLAGDDPRRLAEFARIADARDGLEAVAEDARRAAEQIVERRVAAGEASPAETVLVAGRAAQRGDAERAIELYRLAIAAEYGHVNWRLALADLLEQTGRYDEALREVRVVQRLRPGLDETTRRIRRLSLLVGQPEPDATSWAERLSTAPTDDEAPDGDQ